MKKIRAFFGWFFSLPKKLWSVKTVPAIIFSVKLFQIQEVGIWMIIMAVLTLVSWALVIGFRYAEKTAGLIKPFIPNQGA